MFNDYWSKMADTTRWRITYFCYFLNKVPDSDESLCGPDEVLDQCPVECPSDRCPKSVDEAKLQDSPRPDVCPPPACKCRFNYRRDENNQCIPTRQCPPFDCSALPFQEYNSCPPLCPNGSCSQATKDGRCPSRLGRIGIVLYCRPACRCIKGYWLKDGMCVPYAECFEDKTEELSDCVGDSPSSVNEFKIDDPSL